MENRSTEVRKSMYTNWIFLLHEDHILSRSMDGLIVYMSS